jgi:putative acetyltransferase
MITIRSETAADLTAIRAVNRQAFEVRGAEGGLVDAVRQSENFIPELSLMAEENGQVVGHILFSRLHIETDTRPVPALALAPMAVLPGYQRQGIGSQFVRRGLETCQSLQHDIVIVLGHPAYYPRFGFSAAAAATLECPFGECGEAWMAMALTPGALQGVRGKVVYPAVFNGV